MKKAVIALGFIFAALEISTGQVPLGEKVPNFTAIDQDGGEWNLKKHLKNAEYLVIYFYPAAFTGGCTQQACAYRDRKGELEKVNAQVAGISGDRPETLTLFALEHQLNFTLLSDTDGTIAGIFGVPRSDGGTIHREIGGKEVELVHETTIQRWTFILDRKGTLIYKDSQVNAAEDSRKVIEFISSLSS